MSRSIPSPQALDELSDSLRALTANLLRITRGAGAAQEVGPQVNDVLKAFIAYHKATGVYPSSHEIAAILSLPQDGTDPSSVGEEIVIRGALQVAALRLLGQQPQEVRGKKD